MTIFRFSLIAFALAAVLTAPALAQEGVRADRILSAKVLHERCAKSDATEAGRLELGYCYGAITGIADAAMTLIAVQTSAQTICLTDDASADQMRSAFLRFAEERPDVLDLPAATVIIAVLQARYPCEK